MPGPTNRFALTSMNVRQVLPEIVSQILSVSIHGDHTSAELVNLALLGIKSLAARARQGDSALTVKSAHATRKHSASWSGMGPSPARALWGGQGMATSVGRIQTLTESLMKSCAALTRSAARITA